MRIISATVGPISAATVNSIATSQSGTANVALTLTSSPFTMDFVRRVLITSAGNDSGMSFTIVGTDWNGFSVSENLTGGNATGVYSIYDYATVVSVTPSANTASTVQVGTNGIASTRPIFVDEYCFSPTALQINTTGTINATVQQSLDDPNAVGYTSVQWINHPDSALSTITSGNVQGNYAYAPKVIRLLLNSGSGSATIRVNQSGAVPF